MTVRAARLSGHGELIAYVALALALSWTIWAPLWLPAFGVTGLPVVPFHHMLGAFGPLLAALIVTLASRGWLAMRAFLRSLVDPGPRWYVGVAALLLPFAILAIGAVVATIGGEQVSFAELGRSSEFPNLSAPAFFACNLLTFGYGEEAGWRGFALPRLQSRHSALVATLILTAIWASWHLPLFLYRPGYVGMDLGGIAGWLMSLLTGAVLLTVLYNASRGSILVVAVFHAAIDVAFMSAGASPLVTTVCGMIVTLLGVAACLWLRPQNLWFERRTSLPGAA